VAVAFTFYGVRPEAFALPVEERRRLAEAFCAACAAAAEHLGVLRVYSLVGLHAGVDVLLWQAAQAAQGLQRFQAALRRTGLYRYLEVPHQYLAMTRPSTYVDPHRGDAQRAVVKPGGAKYLFVYPFVKTRAWYALPLEERQRIMDHHMQVGRRYPGVKINTTYSFGLDDQEFVVAFEGDSPSEFLDLVMELRGSESSQYTLRDTPSFTGLAQPLERALELALGLESREAQPAASVGELAAARG
jgi:chlorite dismutase